MNWGWGWWVYVSWHHYLPPPWGLSIQLCGCQVFLFSFSSSVCSLRLAEWSCWGRWMDGEMLLIICAELLRPRLDQTCVLWFLWGRYLSLARLFMLVSVVDSLHLYSQHHAHSCLFREFMRACVCLSRGAPLTQSASARIPGGADGGAARALPCPPHTRSC